MENDVLPADPAPRTAAEDDLHALGDTEPDFAGHHDGREIGAPDAGGEGPQGTVRAGVAVGADDHVAGDDDPLLVEQDVLDSAAPAFVIVGQALLPGELPEELHLPRREDVLVGGEVVRHQDDPGGIEDLSPAGFPELVDGDGRRDVVPQGHVHAGVDEHARTDVREVGVPEKDFFGDGEAHLYSLHKCRVAFFL